MKAIRDHQKAIRGHQRPAEAIATYQPEGGHAAEEVHGVQPVVEQPVVVWSGVIIGVDESSASASADGDRDGTREVGRLKLTRGGSADGVGMRPAAVGAAGDGDLRDDAGDGDLRDGRAVLGDAGASSSSKCW